MQIVQRGPWRAFSGVQQPGRVLLGWLLLLLSHALAGCAALDNPVANGIPVRRLPPELLGESKANLKTIPLAVLRQPRPDAYKLAADDVLGVWIEGILGEKGQIMPVRYSEKGDQAPALGYPIPVRSDGTIPLPFVPPIKVEGMTLEQAEAAIRKSYTVDKQIIQAGRDRIFVTLQQARRYHILVIRQDSASPTEGGSPSTGGRTTGFVISVGGGGSGARRGTGFAIDLPAYENDLLNALARTGGFPGSDAVNEIVIERGSFKGSQDRADLMDTLRTCPPGQDLVSGAGKQTIRIPLRTPMGKAPPLNPESIVLQTGDVVFIAAREADVFYAGGLLPPGEYVLPRDVDLDVVEAIARIGGVIDSGGINALNITGTTLPIGIGDPSPRLVTVVRKTANGGQVAIRVDLNRALRDPRERILIQPRDLIILQEDPQDAIARYFSTAFNFSFVYRLVNNTHATATTNLSVP